MSVNGKVKVNKWKVIMDDLLITIKGSTRKIKADRVSQVLIDKSFDDKFLPVMKIKVRLENSLMHEIKTNYDKTIFNISIHSSIYDNETKDTTYNQPWIKGQFIYIPENVTPDMNAGLNNVDERTETKSAESTLTEMEFGLFSIDMLTKYRKLTNVIMSNVNANSAVAALITKCGIKTLMTPSQNNKTIPQLIMKPMNFLSGIDLIHNHIGLYPTGYRLFQDYDIMYLLDNSGKCNAYRTNEIHRVYLNVSNSIEDKSLVHGMNVNSRENNIMINIATDNIHIKALAPLYNELGFTTIKTISDSDIKMTASIKMKSTTKGKYTKYLHNQYGNPYILSSRLNNMKENSFILSTILYDIDARLLTPNKEYIFKFSDINQSNKYAGTYKISKLFINMMTTDKSMITNAYCEFKKIV